jgi:hypothetical protein
MTDDRDRWWDKLNRAMFPWLGPAQLGVGRGRQDRPLVTAEQRAASGCPMCGRPMSEHVIERSGDWSTSTRMHCPA